MNKKSFLALLIASLTSSFGFSQNTFKVPYQNRYLNIDFKGFKVEKQIYTKDSSAFQLSAFNKKSGMTLSIFIEKSDKVGDKLACRDFYWARAERSPLAKENLKKYETEHIAVVEHDTKEYNGMPVNYHSVNAYLASANFWVDVHISKMNFSEKDNEKFVSLLSSVNFK